MRMRRTAAAIGALLMASILLVGQSAAAAPPSPGFHSTRPVRGLEWVPSELPALAKLKVRVVCPADDGREYFLKADVSSLSNNSVRVENLGQPVECTGRPQTVSVDVWTAIYATFCRVEAGTYPATVSLVRLIPGAPPYQRTEELATVTPTVKIRTPSPSGTDCRNLE
jgi:hypothetical protein